TLWRIRDLCLWRREGILLTHPLALSACRTSFSRSAEMRYLLTKDAANQDGPGRPKAVPGSELRSIRAAHPHQALQDATLQRGHGIDGSHRAPGQRQLQTPDPRPMDQIVRVHLLLRLRDGFGAVAAHLDFVVADRLLG